MIRVKRARVVVAADGKRRSTQLVPLRFNAAQLILADYVAECWHKRVRVRALIPKARQMGISTFWQAIMFGLAVLSPGYHGLTVAHLEASAGQIFAKSRTFEANLSDTWKLPLDNRQQNRITWEENRAANRAASSIWVAMITTGEGLGRGPTLSAIHFSEAGFYTREVGASRAQGGVSAAMGALDEGPDSIVAWESTADGRDPYFYVKCEAAKNPESVSEERVIFLPWFLDPGYSMTWEEYRRSLIESGKRDPGERYVANEEELLLRRQLEETVVAPSERSWKYCVRLSDDQLIYWRWLLANKCEGRPELRSKEYPSTYDEAFSSTVQAMWDGDTCEHYLRKSRDPLAVGNVVPAGASVVFESNPRLGKLKVWEHPKPGESYVIGADIGGERRGSDPCAAYVVNSHTLETVAAFHGHMEFDHYTDYLYHLGQHYNWSLLVVENNHNPAVAAGLHKMGYPALYYYVYEGQLKGTPNRPGFNTNRKTRPELMAALDSAVRRRAYRNYDVGFARELPTFVWVERDKHYAAEAPNHDDRIMAAALAVYHCQGRDRDPEEESERDQGYAVRRFAELQELARHVAAQKKHDAGGMVVL